MLLSYWAPSTLLCFQLVRVLRNWDLLSGVKVRYAVVVQIVELYFNFQCLLYHTHIFLRPLLMEDSLRCLTWGHLMGVGQGPI